MDFDPLDIKTNHKLSVHLPFNKTFTKMNPKQTMLNNMNLDMLPETIEKTNNFSHNWNSDKDTKSNIIKEPDN